MQKFHKDYEKLKELVAGRLSVTFPGWVRGTWSLALFFRGFTQMYYDVYDNPNFVKEFLDFLAEARISWEKQRCEFLGKKPTDLDNWFSNNYVDYRFVHASDQYSDEVDGNMISRESYKELIFPSEKKVADFYGRTFYYHSCGNLTKILDPLATLPNLGILHVSSWTDLKTAREMTGENVIIQKVLHPEDEVMHATPEKIRSRTREILEAIPDRKLWICADAIYSGDVEKVKQWVTVCKETVAEYT
jgi:uroporphyrinogen-III decarboxylase